MHIWSLFLSRICFFKQLTHFRGYGIHSPYLFGLVNDMLLNSYPFYCFEALAQFRNAFKNNEAKHALTLSSGLRLFRALNSINANKTYAFQPDFFDKAILTSVGSYTEWPTEGFTYEGENSSVLFYLCADVTQYTDSFFGECSKMKCAIIVVKCPFSQNKVLWQKALKQISARSSIAFFEYGFIFTNPEITPLHCTVLT